MRALYNRVHTKDPTWKLAGFIVDDPSVDVLTIREVFQCSVLICFWRVRHTWHKNLMKRCSDVETRAELSRRLGQAVHDICRGPGTVDLFENFMEDFVDCSDFMDYFKAIWYPRIGPWISALKSMPLASQETCAGLELYHNQLKIRLLNEKDPDIYRRADWLVDKLGTKVQAYFWLDEYSGRDDFSRYWKDEWASGLTAWRKSLMILDSDVVRQGECVKVIDQHDRDVSHVVRNPGTEYAICDCSWAEKGNLCEHAFKVIKLFRDKGSVLPSISLIQYNQGLINMLRCPPHDSFIRDHAVALAVWVHEQLSAQVGQESSHGVANPIEQHREVANENNCRNENPIEQHREVTNENSTSHGEDRSAVVQGASQCRNGDLGSV